MGSIWKAIVAFLNILWYNLEAIAENFNRQKTLREAAEKRTAELEAQRAREIEAEIEKELRESTEILSGPDPAAGARDWLSSSFKDN